MDNQLAIEDPDNWESALVAQHLDGKTCKSDNSDDEQDSNYSISQEKSQPKLSRID
jgi:hypothetical protein